MKKVKSQVAIVFAMCLICTLTGSLTADDWLDKYLSEELQYDEQQVKQFKENVADMSEEDMRTMLRQIKHQRQFRDIQREILFDAQQSNFKRLQEARAMAHSHPAHSAYYTYNQRIRTINRNPGGQSLFRGYFVGILVR